MPFPDDLVADLRELAEASAVLTDIPREQTIEWSAADAVETMARALREIAEDRTVSPALIATVALMVLAAVES